MRASSPVLLAALIGLVPGGFVSADEELPDDEFLEFLGVWDQAWTEACDPDQELFADDACLELDDDEQEYTQDES